MHGPVALGLTHGCVSSVHRDVQQVRLLSNKEDLLVYSFDVNSSMNDLLLRSVRGAEGDRVPMDACFFLPEQYSVGTHPAAYLHVRSWRLLGSHVLTKSTDVIDYICYERPFQAKLCSFLLEAVDIDTAGNVRLAEVPTVRLRLGPVPVKDTLDGFHRLLFIEHTMCTACHLLEAKYKSIDACSYGGGKAIYSALCNSCLRELFVKVHHGQRFHWRPASWDWVLDLQARQELYFFSCAQAKIAASGAPERGHDAIGIYALKHEYALAQGFASWPALYMHERRKRAAKRHARK